MVNILATLAEIQAATRAAKARLSDDTLATRVRNGKIQIVSVTYPTPTSSKVVERSAWMPLEAVCGALEVMQ